MKRFEELMNIPENSERYEHLKNDICREKLVVFFGAGLSLGEKSTRWGYPFEWTYDELNNLLDSLKNLIKSNVEHNDFSLDDILKEPKKDEEREIRQEISDIQDLLKKVKCHNAAGEYLEAGDVLTTIIDKFREPCKRWGKQYELNEKPIQELTFNDFIITAFMKDSFGKIYSSPYTIPAIFYLPYISQNLITTNVDLSFDKATESIKKPNWPPTVITPSSNVSDCTPNSNSIFYIHGNISKPESLVMSKAQYNKMYPKRIGAYDGPRGVRALLGNTIKNYSLLFLGAKLKNDRTVQVINWVASQDDTLKHRKCKNLRLFHMVQADSYGRLVDPDHLNFSEPIKYYDDQHREITLLLLQLIRETASDWAHCSWKEPEFKSNSHKISASLMNKIIDSFEKSDTYESITVDQSKDGSAEDLIRYLYNHHSIQKHDEGLGWNICCVSENKFSLGEPEGETFPLHNYPIGDTVYVFFSCPKDYGEWSLYNEEVYRRIVPSIEDWRKTYFPSYPNMQSTEEFSSFSPRIRVIIFSLPPSPKEKEEKEQEQKFNEMIYKVSDLFKEIPKHSLSPEEMEILQSTFRQLFHELVRTARSNIENPNAEEITATLNKDNIKTLKR